MEARFEAADEEHVAELRQFRYFLSRLVELYPVSTLETL